MKKTSDFTVTQQPQQPQQPQPPQHVKIHLNCYGETKCKRMEEYLFDRTKDMLAIPLVSDNTMRLYKGRPYNLYIHRTSHTAQEITDRLEFNNPGRVEF